MTAPTVRTNRCAVDILPCTAKYSIIITEQKHAEKENFMKRKLAILLIVLIFVAGIGIMSYPLVSSAINNYVSRSSVKEYTNKVAQMPSEKTQKMFEEATKYNNSLSNNMIITDPFDEKAFQKIGERYEHTLSVDEDGLIGYIDIPKINVYLPIYHGTSEEILSKGAGHLQNTSLPVGGKSTHAVISAHSGYPGETFFDYLTDMKVGDEFYVHILDRTLKYEVDQIEVVLPSEINSLRIVDGEDLVTLLTCTPYGVNTHRLLVRGKHVAYDDTKYVETGVSLAKFDNGYIFFLGYKIPYAVAAGIIVGFVALVVFVVIFLLKRKKKKSVGAKRLKADSADENSDDSGGDADA
jgi:sortase A